MVSKKRAKSTSCVSAFLLLFPLCLSHLAHANSIPIPIQTLEGTLSSNADGALVFRNDLIPYQHVFYPKGMARSMRSLLDTHRPIRMETYWDRQTQEIEVLKTPTFVGALKQVRGVFSKNEADHSYRIGDQKVRITRHEPLTQENRIVTNGTQIDSVTIQSWIGKKVIARGEMNQGILDVVALVPAGMLTAEDPTSTNERNIFEGEISRGHLPEHRSLFRAIDAKAPSPGDSVFMLTLSGRQGDDVDAVGGHFAAGMGTVQKDLSIEGEFFNVYVQNEKDIVPGNTDWVTYFGHFIEGQSNYRPTYTLILYGLSPDRIQKIRDLLDLYHPIFRSGKIPLSINFNCTTLSVQAMAAAGLYGQHRNGKNNTAAYPILNSELPILKRPITDIQGRLNFAMQSNGSEYMPRPAFESILQNLMTLNQTENLGIQRADLIFSPQNKSRKPRGGAPLSSFGQALKLQLLMSLGGYSTEQALSNLD